MAVETVWLGDYERDYATLLDDLLGNGYKIVAALPDRLILWRSRHHQAPVDDADGDDEDYYDIDDGDDEDYYDIDDDAQNLFAPPPLPDIPF